MSLIQKEEYRDLGLNEMTKLSLNKPGIDWWGYDPAPGLMYSFNIRVPCGEACRRHLNEVMRVHRYLDDTFDWRKHLSLSNDSTNLSPEQIRAFAETEEMRLATRIVSSIEPTADFAPCCKPPFDK